VLNIKDAIAALLCAMAMMAHLLIYGWLEWPHCTLCYNVCGPHSLLQGPNRDSVGQIRPITSAAQCWSLESRRGGLETGNNHLLQVNQKSNCKESSQLTNVQISMDDFPSPWKSVKSW